MHGYGRGIFDWGGFYEGLWQNNMWHGQGKFVNEQGHVYEGQWASNVPHGQLSIIKKDKYGKTIRISGTWVHGKLDGKDWQNF